MTADREALDALLDRVFPLVQPQVQRSYAMRGDDYAVDARDDQRRAVDEFIDALVDDPDLQVLAAPLTETQQRLTEHFLAGGTVEMRHSLRGGTYWYLKPAPEETPE